MTSFSKKHPVWCSILVTVGALLLLGGASIGSQLLIYDGTYARYFLYGAITSLAQLLLGVGCIVLMRRMQLVHGAFRAKGIFAGIGYGWYAVVFSVGSLCVNLLFSEMQFSFNFWPFTVMLVAAFSTGFFEEVLVRGFVLHVLQGEDRTPRSIQKACFGSSIIFGLAHLVNLISGEDLISTISQVIYATFVGTLLAAVYMRSKTLWAPIILHTILDFASFVLNAIMPKTAMEAMMQMPAEPVSLLESIKSALPMIVLTLPCVVCALVLLRRKKLQQIIDDDVEIVKQSALPTCAPLVD